MRSRMFVWCCHALECKQCLNTQQKYPCICLCYEMNELMVKLYLWSWFDIWPKFPAHIPAPWKEGLQAEAEGAVLTECTWQLHTSDLQLNMWLRVGEWSLLTTAALDPAVLQPAVSFRTNQDITWGPQGCSLTWAEGSNETVKFEVLLLLGPYSYPRAWRRAYRSLDRELYVTN